MMILGSILETFWEPSLLRFCFLDAPVANACMCFASTAGKFPSSIFSVKSELEGREGAGRGQRSAAEAEPAEAGRLRLRALKGLVLHI